jgi:hypothetical protein
LRIARRTASRLARDSFGFDATYSRTDATRFLDRLAVMLRTLCAHPKPIVGFRRRYVATYAFTRQLAAARRARAATEP